MWSVCEIDKVDSQIVIVRGLIIDFQLIRVGKNKPDFELTIFDIK